MRRFLPLLFAFAVLGASAKEFSVGRLTVCLDDRTGWPVRYCVDGRTMLSGTQTPRTPFCAEYADASGLHRDWRAVEAISFAPVGKAACVSRMRAGDWEADLRLELYPGDLRVCRRVTLRWRGLTEIQLKKFWMRAGSLADGTAFIPASWGEKKPSSSRDPHVVIGEGKGGWSVVWSRNSACPWGDNGLVTCERRVDDLNVTEFFDSAGWVRPGEEQTIGDAWISFVPGGRDDALRTLPNWFAAVGQHVPADRPDWIHHAVIYTCHPAGTRESGRLDGGGFRQLEGLLPEIAELGCNLVWLQPVEDAPYNPKDYYRLADGVGSESDYKSFVNRAHELGLRVWGDLISHGGCPGARHFEGRRRCLALREDGTPLPYWCADLNNPEWLKLMSAVTGHFMREYGLDGYRMDAAFGTRIDNWSRDIPYARASFARLQGGFAVQRTVRSAAREVKGDAAVLAEAAQSAFACTADVIWDFDLGCRVLRDFRSIPAEELTPKLRRWLHEQQLATVPGALYLRYADLHDLLDASRVYGQAAHVALTAVAAWIRGVPVVTHEREDKNYEAYRRIFRLRQDVPEMAGDDVDYLRPPVPPGVFACLWKGSGGAAAVPLVNLTPKRQEFELRADGHTPVRVELGPYEHLIRRLDGTQPAVSKRTDGIGLSVRRSGNKIYVDGARSWFARTAEGTFEGRWRVRHPGKREVVGGMMRLPCGGNCLWDGGLHPFGFAKSQAMVGAMSGGRAVCVSGFAPHDRVRIFDSEPGYEGLVIEVEGSNAFKVEETPATDLPQEPVGTGDKRLVVIPGGWLFDDGRIHQRIRLNGAPFDGGFSAEGEITVRVSERQKLLFSQADDLEAVSTFERLADGRIRMLFSGELRNLLRDGKMPHATAYRTEWTLGGREGAVCRAQFKTDPKSSFVRTRFRWGKQDRCWENGSPDHWTEAVFHVAGASNAVLRCATPERIVICQDRGDALYHAGEDATFTVSVRGCDGRLVTTGAARWNLDNFGMTNFGNGTVDLARENPFAVVGRMDEAGFLRLTVNAGTNSAVWSVGYDVEDIRQDEPCPADFDAYWRGEVARLAREVPLDARCRREERFSRKGFDCYRVSFATFGGKRVYGFLSVPTDKTGGPFGVRVNVPGAGPGVIAPVTVPGEICLTMNVHCFEPATSYEDQRRLMREQNAALAKKYALRDLKAYCSVAGLAVSREDYWYHDVLLGINRAVDWVCARSDVDLARVTYKGSSQGGGFGLFLNYLNPHFTKAFVAVCAITGHFGYKQNRQPGWPNLVRFQDAGKREISERNAAYFDGVNFAARIRHPIRFLVGFRDACCAPANVYAAYNACPSIDKAIVNAIGSGHDWMTWYGRHRGVDCFDIDAWLHDK